MVIFNLRYICLVALALLAPLFVAGEDPLNALNTSLKAPELPQAGGASGQGVVIDQSNAAQYRTLIISPLFDSVQSGEWSMQVIKSPNFKWRYDLNSATSDPVRLDEKTFKAVANEAALKVQAIPFKIIDSFEGLSEEELNRVGQAMLYNFESLLWKQQLLSLDFSLLWFTNDALRERFSGSFSRVYSSLLEGPTRQVQLFRELLKFEKPEALSDYQWLSFRFLNERKDLLWMFSPAINKVRQLTSSNRSDPLYRTILSLEDIFGWSGQLKELKVLEIAKERALVPMAFFEHDLLKPADEHCLTVDQFQRKSALGRSTLRWNFESRRFMQARPWVATGSIYTPRDLYRVSFVSMDPYVKHGRQVLYLDASSFMPVYKIVYNRGGMPEKFVVTTFGLASTEDQSAERFYPAYTTVQSFDSKIAVILAYDQVRYCSAFPKDLSLADFDPGKLKPVVEEPPAPELNDVKKADIKDAAKNE